MLSRVCGAITYGKGGEKMSLDALKQVTESEERAKAAQTAAQAKAKILVETAQREGEARLDSALRQAQDQVKELLTEAETHGRETTKSALAQYEKDCEELKAQAGKKLAQAARLIVGKVVRD